MTSSFIILIREPEEHHDWEPAERDAEKARIHAAHGAFFEAIAAAGAAFEDGAGLQPTSAAVRITPARDGQPAVFTDGPFGETKEVISGYYKVSAPSREIARTLAAQCPTSGWIELWPVMETGAME
jgi:hypothetical protein